MENGWTWMESGRNSMKKRTFSPIWLGVVGLGQSPGKPGMG